jgi:hypothetical protein
MESIRPRLHLICIRGTKRSGPYSGTLRETITELYYITGGPARDKKVSAKTWRILRHFHDNTLFSW